MKKGLETLSEGKTFISFPKRIPASVSGGKTFDFFARKD